MKALKPFLPLIGFGAGLLGSAASDRFDLLPSVAYMAGVVVGSALTVLLLLVGRARRWS